MISPRKAKHPDVTTMFTYSHANTTLGQSEPAYYLSYFIKVDYIRLVKISAMNEKNDIILHLISRLEFIYLYTNFNCQGRYTDGELPKCLNVRRGPRVKYRIISFMHLSMLSPRVGGGGGGGRATHGKLTERAFPRVGNLTWPPSWKTERNWK